MRKLVFFTIGYAAAMAIGAYWLSGGWLVLYAVVCLLLGGICLLLKDNISFWKQALAICFGCVIGIIWMVGYQELYLSGARSYNGKTVFVAVTVTDYSWQTQYGTACDAEITLEGRTYQLRMYANAGLRLSPGDVVAGEFKLHYTGSSENRSDTYLSSSGLHLVAYPEDTVTVQQCTKQSLRFLGVRLRKRIKDALNSVFPTDTQAFARALLLGDSTDLAYEMDTDFKLSGIRHVIAVSGLHVSILFALVYQMAGKRRVLTALVGIPVLILFAAVAGFTPSIVRACVMQSLMILAMLLDKEYDPPTALAFAVLIMLAVNPAAITSVSLQLSVGCMIGIFSFSKGIQDYLLQEKRLGTGKGKSLRAVLARWLASGIGVSLSAMVFTAPLSAVYFGTFTVLSVITNLVTLWAVNIIFYGIMASCVLSFIWLPAAKQMASLISWLMRYVCTVAHGIASIPVATVYTCSVYVVFWLIFAYVLIAVFSFCKKRSPVALTICLSISLVLSVAASWLEPRLDDCRITVMDVGQGQCILLQSDNKRYLVDCGGSSDTLAADTAAAQLLSQGVWELDGIIVTHYDADHAGGVEYLLTRVDTKALYLPAMDETTQLDDRLLTAYADKAIIVDKTQFIGTTDAKLTIFAPDEQTSRNESSLCILFQAENCDILITGDRGITGERALLAQAQLPQLEVLIAGHHGAEDSTGLELLSKTHPGIVVISVDKNNRYGHPSDAVLRRLSMFGCSIYRTDLDGTVIIRR